MHSFSEADIPQDWRELLGDYFESREWAVLKSNLQAILIQDPGIITPKPENF